MSTKNPWFEREGLALLTDFYELTMMAGYLSEDRHQSRVCFEYFFRHLPPHGGFAIACGLDSFLRYLENLRFEEEDLEYLRSLHVFDDTFLQFLSTFEPNCTVRAVPEGTLVFPHEPIVQIEGTIIEAQLIESALLNLMNYQTLLATKASRICLAAEGENVLEFGLRRAHGPDGALSGSRACYIGGCSATSNVLAGKVFGIPVSGTHAHSWVMSFPTEIEAFRAFARHYPDRCVMLVDTYDTLGSGVPNAITVFNELRDAGHPVRPAIRLDSGDLAKLSKAAYRMMREAGYDDPMIVASNDLDEDLIADLKRQGAKINAWGVGTHLITAGDCPSLSGVYKLVAIEEDGEWEPRIKISSNLEKATSPGRKTLIRYYDKHDAPLGDIYYSHDEDYAIEGEITAHDRVQAHRTVRINNAARAVSLFETVFHEGKRVDTPRPIAAIRESVLAQLATLPEEYKRLRNPEIYRVMMSPGIHQIRNKLLRVYDAV